MALIIELNRDVDTSSDAHVELTGNSGRGAEVIIFPGVRYERWGQQPPVATGGAAGTNAPVDGATRRGRNGTAAGAKRAPRDWLEL